VATNKGFLRIGWTAAEFKGQGGCGVVATDVVGVTKDYDAEVAEMIVSFADRLDWDGDCDPAKGSTSSWLVRSKGFDLGLVSKPHWGPSLRNDGARLLYRTLSHTIAHYRTLSRCSCRIRTRLRRR
jgi:hypothetical protein